MPKTITISADDVGHFRTMLREQLAGDHELMRDVVAGRADGPLLDETTARIALVDRLASEVGGLY